MLSQTRRGLIEDGLVWRQVESTTPPSVTYGLTGAGFDVAEPLTNLLDRITGGGRPDGLSPAGTPRSSARQDSTISRT